MKHIGFIILILSISLSACRRKPEPLHEALEQMVQRFPKVSIQDSEGNPSYKYYSTIYDAKYKVEIQTIGLENYDRVLAIKNEQGQYYALPTFDNKHTHYWNFELGESKSKPNDHYRTFEKELLTAFKTLNIQGLAKRDLTHEVLHFALNTDVLTPSNANNICSCFLSDTCKINSKDEKTKRAIFSPEGLVDNFQVTSYGDSDRRAYQVIEEWQDGKFIDLALKIYRLDLDYDAPVFYFD